MIKASALLETVKELGEKYPSHRADCIYFHDNGRPCCIVGRALAELGVTKKELRGDAGEKQWLAVNKQTSVHGLLDERPDLIEDDLTYEQWIALDNTQAAQDCNDSWGEAVKNLREPSWAR